VARLLRTFPGRTTRIQPAGRGIVNACVFQDDAFQNDAFQVCVTAPVAKGGRIRVLATAVRSAFRYRLRSHVQVYRIRTFPAVIVVARPKPVKVVLARKRRLLRAQTTLGRKKLYQRLPRRTSYVQAQRRPQRRTLAKLFRPVRTFAAVVARFPQHIRSVFARRQHPSQRRTIAKLFRPVRTFAAAAARFPRRVTIVLAARRPQRRTGLRFLKAIRALRLPRRITVIAGRRRSQQRTSAKLFRPIRAAIIAVARLPQRIRTVFATSEAAQRRRRYRTRNYFTRLRGGVVVIPQGKWIFLLRAQQVVYPQDEYIRITPQIIFLPKRNKFARRITNVIYLEIP
jgi:hypothetical protein